MPDRTKQGERQVAIRLRTTINTHLQDCGLTTGRRCGE
jgi:hypothetical protein